MKEYKSEKGAIHLIAAAVGSILIISFLAVFNGTAAQAERILLISAYITAAAAYFISVVFPIINTRYIIQDKALEIRCGFYKQIIPSDKIIDITQKKSFGREPALGQNRLYLKYRDKQDIKTVGISPKSREDFINNISGTGMADRHI